MCTDGARWKRDSCANKILSHRPAYRRRSLHQLDADEPTSVNTWPPGYLSTPLVCTQSLTSKLDRNFRRIPLRTTRNSPRHSLFASNIPRESILLRGRVQESLRRKQITCGRMGKVVNKSSVEQYFLRVRGRRTDGSDFYKDQRKQFSSVAIVCSSGRNSLGNSEKKTHQLLAILLSIR